MTEAFELVILVGMKYAMELSNLIRFHGIVELVLNERDLNVAELKPIERPVSLMERRKIWENKIWIVKSHVDLETNYHVY